MECLTCGETMKCYDGVNADKEMIGWFKCYKCGAWSQITFNAQGEKETVIWLKERRNSD